MKRVPLWVTLIPLVVGLAAYWHYWDRQRDAFERAVTAVVGRDVEVGGFPYRLEAEFADARLVHRGAYVLDTRADRIRVNRQPGRPELVSIAALRPSLSWRAPALKGALFTVASATAQSSVRIADARIARLSNVHQDARLRLPLLPLAVSAETFEWHFRETPAAPDPTSRAPTFPEQAQLVLSATGLRLGGGAGLKMAAQIGVTSALPVWDLVGWRRGGTVEIGRLTLDDAHGELVAIEATASAGPTDQLRIAGTLDTVCPLTVQAAFAGTVAPATEFRTRRPVRFGFGGRAGAIELAAPATARALPVRAQEAPCPELLR